jgi:hypothetical protein
MADLPFLRPTPPEAPDDPARQADVRDVRAEAGVKPLVEVIWEDALRLPMGWDSEEHYLEETKAPPTMHTAGYLLEENEDFVAVIFSWGDNGQVADLLRVPRGIVREVRRLT